MVGFVCWLVGSVGWVGVCWLLGLVGLARWSVLRHNPGVRRCRVGTTARGATGWFLAWGSSLFLAVRRLKEAPIVLSEPLTPLCTRAHSYALAYSNRANRAPIVRVHTRALPCTRTRTSGARGTPLNAKCRGPIEAFFAAARPRERSYGVVPTLAEVSERLAGCVVSGI